MVSSRFQLTASRHRESHVATQMQHSWRCNCSSIGGELKPPTSNPKQTITMEEFYLSPNRLEAKGKGAVLPEEEATEGRRGERRTKGRSVRMSLNITEDLSPLLAKGNSCMSGSSISPPVKPAHPLPIQRRLWQRTIRHGRFNSTPRWAVNQKSPCLYENARGRKCAESQTRHPAYDFGCVHSYPGVSQTQRFK